MSEEVDCSSWTFRSCSGVEVEVEEAELYEAAAAERSWRDGEALRALCSRHELEAMSGDEETEVETEVGVVGIEDEADCPLASNLSLTLF